MEKAWTQNAGHSPFTQKCTWEKHAPANRERDRGPAGKVGVCAVCPLLYTGLTRFMVFKTDSQDESILTYEH